jgi:hypothetical protein
LTLTPVSRRLAVYRIKSTGPFGTKDKGYYETYALCAFAGFVGEGIEAEKPRLTLAKTEIDGGKSALYGVVKDRLEAVVPRAKVMILNHQTQKTYELETDAQGLYLQTGLPSGYYSVKVNAAGFKTTLVNYVYLFGERVGAVDVALEPGNVAETVYLSISDNIALDIGETRIDTNITQQIIQELPLNGRNFSSLLRIAPGVRPEALAGGFMIDGASGAENAFVVDGQEVANFRSGALNDEEEEAATAGKRTATPRLREYFPETLVWQPELLTDRGGAARLKFRLADNITTWKLYAIASDEKGRVGVTAKEIRAFQPFFVDLDPPRFLTAGDEIALPVQIRNYTKQTQKVEVEMAAGDWFSLLGAGQRAVEVASNATQKAIFDFRAEKATDDGRQKVTAVAETDADAIEKPVTVRPNGQEIVSTQSKTFTGSAGFDVAFPANSLPDTQRGELKIYPNLFAHVTESVGGLLRRPYGCGEQTISSTYPNLMVLKFAKNNAELQGQARRFLKKGYERLLGYRSPGGGFTYWGKGDPDPSLTVYAFRFLSDAREFTAVDENLLNETRDWLVGKQAADGSIAASPQKTAYFARTLARRERDEKSNLALKKALGYLKKRPARPTFTRSRSTAWRRSTRAASKRPSRSRAGSKRWPSSRKRAARFSGSSRAARRFTPGARPARSKRRRSPCSCS